MFTKKKSFYQRKMLYVVLIAVLAFGYFFNQFMGSPNVDTNVNVPTNDQENTHKEAIKPNPDDAYAAETNDGEKDGIESENDQQTQPESSSYYLVKEVDGIIKIYYCDNEGKENLLQNTNISFPLISETDQKMFSEGVIISTEEELLNLLQDFES